MFLNDFYSYIYLYGVMSSVIKDKAPEKTFYSGNLIRPKKEYCFVIFKNEIYMKYSYVQVFKNEPTYNKNTFNIYIGGQKQIFNLYGHNDTLLILGEISAQELYQGSVHSNYFLCLFNGTKVLLGTTDLEKYFNIF